MEPTQENGFIVLHRKILKWEWMQIPEMVALFIRLLLLANHEDHRWQGQIIHRGQCVIGRLKLSKESGISQQTIRTCLERLKSTSEITIKPTNRYSIITLVKYGQYQDKPKKQPANQPAEQPTTNQQLTTNNNDNNITNSNNTCGQGPHDEVNLLLKEFYEINPGLNFGNLTQRKAAEFIIKKFGLDTATAMVKWYRQQMTDRFCPVATTPYQFKEKLGDIKAYADRLKTKKSNRFHDLSNL